MHVVLSIIRSQFFLPLYLSLLPQHGCRLFVQLRIIDSILLNSCFLLLFRLLAVHFFLLLQRVLRVFRLIRIKRRASKQKAARRSANRRSGTLRASRRLSTGRSERWMRLERQSRLLFATSLFYNGLCRFVEWCRAHVVAVNDHSQRSPSEIRTFFNVFVDGLGIVMLYGEIFAERYPSPQGTLTRKTD